MLVVSQHDIGRAAWDRMRRERSVVALTSAMGLPADIAATPELRAAAIASSVPSRCAVTGVAALWIWGYVAHECPLPFRVAVPRGRHPDPPPGRAAHTWAWHTDSGAFAAALNVGGVRVVSPTHAVGAALRVDPLEIALPASMRALEAKACDVRDVDQVMAAQSSAILGRERQLSAWSALRHIIRAPGVALP